MKKYFFIILLLKVSFTFSQSKKEQIDILKNNVSTFYNDVLLSRLQPNFAILANKKPVFYQSSKFNIGMHEENWTKFEINI